MQRSNAWRGGGSYETPKSPSWGRVRLERRSAHFGSLFVDFLVLTTKSLVIPFWSIPIWPYNLLHFDGTCSTDTNSGSLLHIAADLYNGPGCVFDIRAKKSFFRGICWCWQIHLASASHFRQIQAFQKGRGFETFFEGLPYPRHAEKDAENLIPGQAGVQLAVGELSFPDTSLVIL